MKKKSRGAHPRPVRTLDEAALSGASGGNDPPPPALVWPYIGQQHNETLVRDRRRALSGSRISS